MPLKKADMNAAIRKAVKKFKKQGYRIPSPVIKAALDLYHKVPTGGIFADLVKTYEKAPGKAGGWFIRRLMEIGREEFGDDACRKVAGTYYEIVRSNNDKRWKVGVKMIEKYWLDKGKDAQES